MGCWTDDYLEIPHAQMDCAEFVQYVLRTHYRRDVCFPLRTSDNLEQRSALIVERAPDFAQRIDAPFDGCGVLIIARGRRAHIGLYVEIGGAGHILHSDDAFGQSILSPLARLPRWYRIEGYYAWI